MKIENMNLEECSKILIKFFELGFDIQKLSVHLKRNVKELQVRLKEEIKQLLIDLEGYLLRSKKISQSIFINLINSEIEKKLIHIDKILDKKSVQDFLTHYRSRLVQFNINLPHHLQTVYPISFESKIRIYHQFVQYARNEHLFSQQLKHNPESVHEIINKGFLEDRYQVYDQRQLDLIYVVFQKKNGDIALMHEEIVNRGFNDAKYDKPLLAFKIANLMVIGLYRVYTLTSTWMDDKILRWNKFIKCYGDIFVSWPIEQQKRLLKIAVNDHASVEQIKNITYRMGTESVKRQRLIGIPVLDIGVQEDIEDDSYELSESLASSIKQQIKRKILSIKK